MTNLSEIEQRLDREAGEWYKQVYDAPLPASFTSIFRRCLMNVPPVQHNLPTEYLRKLANRQIYDLTRADIGIMLNVIFNSPIGHYAPEGELEDQLDLLEVMGNIRNQFNKEAKEKSDYFVKKWKTQAQLSGIVMDKSVAQYKPKIHTA